MQTQTFVRILDPRFLEKGARKWPGSRDEARSALERYSTISSFDFLLTAYMLSDFSETLVEDVKRWTYSDFVCSALSETFSKEVIPSRSAKRFAPYAWLLVVRILMNYSLSDDILFFLKNNNFSYNEKIKNHIIEAVIFDFNRKNFLFGNQKCIRNVLSFIEMDEKEIDKLVKTFLIENNLQSISTYLLSATKSD